MAILTELIKETAALPGHPFILESIGILIGAFTLGLALISFIFFLIGKLWKGKAKFHQLFYALTITLFPIAFELCYIVIWLFMNDVGSPPPVPFALRFIIWVLEIRILIYGIKKFQGFDTMTAILNVVFPWLLGMMIFYRNIILVN